MIEIRIGTKAQMKGSSGYFPEDPIRNDTPCPRQHIPPGILARRYLKNHYAAAELADALNCALITSHFYFYSLENPEVLHVNHITRRNDNVCIGFGNGIIGS